MGIRIRPGHHGDAAALLALYQAVAAQPGSLARRVDEMEMAYVDGFVAAALKRGVWLVAEDGPGLVGSIHASRPLPQDFQHVLGELTLVVHPRAQGRGQGSALFAAFLDHVRDQEPQIQRVELITRDSNVRARRIYERLGFQLEGRLKARVRHADGRLEDDLFYAWHRNAPH
jgi:putative acetyltransferase